MTNAERAGRIARAVELHCFNNKDDCPRMFGIRSMVEFILNECDDQAKEQKNEY